MKKVKLLLGMLRGKFATLLTRLKRRKEALRNRRAKIQNKKRIRVFTNCDTLPAWRFFKVLYGNELRYLLDCDTLPEYFEPLLRPVWDDIISEYDALTGRFDFKNAFSDVLEDVESKNELIILRACYNMMIGGDLRALGHLKEYGFNFKSINIDNVSKLLSKIKRIETKQKIEAINKNNTEKKENNYISNVVNMSNILGRNLDSYNITVSEWVAASEACNRIIEAQKDHGKNY